MRPKTALMTAANTEPPKDSRRLATTRGLVATAQNSLHERVEVVIKTADSGIRTTSDR